MPNKRPKAYDISRKRVQELIRDPCCIRDAELSDSFTDAYQLPTGAVLRSHLAFGERGIVFESREEYVAFETPRYEATSEPPQLDNDSDEFLPQDQIFWSADISRSMDQAADLEGNLSRSGNYVYLYQTEQEDIPLEQRRGLDSIDLDDLLVLVQAPIEQVTQAFSQVRQAERCEHDVYDREVKIIGQDFIVFQFRGHSWTLIHELGFPLDSPLGDEDAQELSGLLNTRAICYAVSDTCGSIGYSLYEHGTSVEMLSFADGDPEDDREVDESQGEFKSAVGVYQFQSQLRQLRTEENWNPYDPELSQNPYEVVEDFFQEQDAYVPAFPGPESFSVGQRVTLRFEGLERYDFERVDHVAVR